MIASSKSTHVDSNNNSSKEPIQVTEHQAAIIKTCLYYSFFNYPLKIEEIKSGVSLSINSEQFNDALNQLIATHKITQIEDYYGVYITAAQIEKRLEEELRFEVIQNKIRRSTKIISRFPFVRGIGISGSVSKGLVKADGDVDFFIICKNDRLWLCRSLLVLNKKLLRLNSRKYFCINYFIGDKSLLIPDQNIFVATELESLVPVYGETFVESLKQKNQWSKNYLPNYRSDIQLPKIALHNHRLKRFCESLFNGKIGERIDHRLRRHTLKRWQKKFPDFTQEQFDLAMRSDRNVSKHHPSNFQLKILDYIDKEYQRIFANT